MGNVRSALASGHHLVLDEIQVSMNISINRELASRDY
jgi:hypothetical protein